MGIKLAPAGSEGTKGFTAVGHERDPTQKNMKRLARMTDRIARPSELLAELMKALARLTVVGMTSIGMTPVELSFFRAEETEIAEKKLQGLNALAFAQPEAAVPRRPHVPQRAPRTRME